MHRALPSSLVPLVPLVSLIAALSLSVGAACSSTSAPPAPPSPAETDAAVAPLAPALGMNDVSVLLPLPSSPGAPGVLGPEDAGERGPLLPKATYDAIPKFGVTPAQGLDYARMRVVAVRFDPCFPGPAGCDPQVRLVMMPITDAGSTLDSAIHLFYRLEEAELAPLVAELRRLRGLAPEVKDAPLDVHAGLAAQGLEGPYGKGLRALVLRYAGDDRFIRMTFFLRAPPRQEEWFFGGFDRVDGKLVQLNIVGVGKANQRVNRPIVPEGYSYELVPSPKVPEDIDALLTTEKAKAASPAAREAAVGALARIENPAKYGPDQLSCAGCHLATYVGAATRAAHGLDVSKHADAYKSSRDLTRVTESSTEASSLRAFGYFASRPMIANRVIYESAAVVDELEKRYPRK
ncbi:MAG: hypothetical protein IPQ09_13730 [Myxococcales bacterium]|nr:hypothetical protein [Myxococcales bacterium]